MTHTGTKVIANIHSKSCWLCYTIC